MTRDEWVAAALAAADEQLGHVAVEDADTLGFIAGVFTTADDSQLSAGDQPKVGTET